MDGITLVDSIMNKRSRIAVVPRSNYRTITLRYSSVQSIQTKDDDSPEAKPRILKPRGNQNPSN